jgi:tRNA(Ile)-lysidine synthase
MADQHPREPKSTLRRVLEAVRRAVRTRELWTPGQRVLLACSGGADSVAALDVLRRLQPSLGHQLVVGHVDHGLWQGSAQAAELVQALCLDRGLTCEVRTLRLDHGADLEARARHARYEALHQIARQHACARIATAHHADDQAETLLLRAARGAGLEALEGIRSHRGDGVVRPLLDVPRAWLQELVQDQRIAHDPSNADPRHSRNRVRLQVLPVLEAALPGASAGLARTAGLLADHGEALQAWLTMALAPRTQEIHGDPAWLRVELEGLPGLRSARQALLRHVAQRLGVEAPSVRAGEQFCAFLTAEASECSVRGLHIERRGGALHFHPTGVARAGRQD